MPTKALEEEKKSEKQLVKPVVEAPIKERPVETKQKEKEKPKGFGLHQESACPS